MARDGAVHGWSCDHGLRGVRHVRFASPPPSLYSAWVVALLIGAILAPTDAAAVAVLLRHNVGFSHRVATQQLLAPGNFTSAHATFLFAKEMDGGILGVCGGYLMLLHLRRLEVETAIYPILALMGSLLLFGGTQTVGSSGFIAVYLAGVVVGALSHLAFFLLITYLTAGLGFNKFNGLGSR